MKWNLKPVSCLKNFAASVSVFTMCLSPVAQGAAAASQKSLINQYLKETGLTTKKMTVGEYWRMIRHTYPEKLQRQMDLWVSINRNELMPKIEASTFKDANGQEQVRLTFSKNGETGSVTFTGDEEKPLKINGTSLSAKELYNYNSYNDLFLKISKSEPAIKKSLQIGALKSPISKNAVLSFNEFSKLSPRQQAEYMIRLRRAAEAAQKVYKAYYGEQAAAEINKKYEWALQLLLGEEAQAAGSLLGKPCIVAGYLSKYGESGSCGGSKQGALDLAQKMSQSKTTCPANGVSCNPMVYGYDAGGAAYCVSRAEVKYATRVCNKKSPLQSEDPKQEGINKKRIIESYLKKMKGQEIDLKLNEEGKISEEQYQQISAYLGDLQKYINSAIGECDQAPLKDIQKVREDQLSACEEIKTRAFSLQTFAVDPKPDAPPSELPEPPTQTCDDSNPGAVKGKDGECICPEGSKKDEEGICVVIEAGGQADLPGGKEAPVKGAESSCEGWCKNKSWVLPLLFIGGASILGYLLFKSLKKGNAKDPVYVPPATVPGSVTPIPTNPVTPVQPPPPAPCPSPSTLVNGVCVPPVVVSPPVTTTTEGGTKTDIPGRAGGTR